MHPIVSKPLNNPSTSCIRVAADPKNLAKIRHFVHLWTTNLQVDPQAVYDLTLAVEEAATNIITHGYQGNSGEIEVVIKLEGDSLVVRIRDQAPPFDPNGVPSPDITLPLFERPFGGLGVFLIKQLVDEFHHRVPPQGGNELTLVKKGIFQPVSEEEKK